MKKGKRSIAALLLAAVISLALAACGTGEDGIVLDGGTSGQPGTVAVKTGGIVTDSWGYTGGAPTQVTAPQTTEVVIKEHTLLTDPVNAVVSGISFTRVSFSTDFTTLPSAARASAPANFVCYLDVAIGMAKNAQPALSATVDVGTALAGQAVTVYYYEPLTGRWNSPQTVEVSSAGTITFPANQLSLWGVFK